jgi:hypothetical protein
VLKPAANTDQGFECGMEERGFKTWRWRKNPGPWLRKYDCLSQNRMGSFLRYFQSAPFAADCRASTLCDGEQTLIWQANRWIEFLILVWRGFAAPIGIDLCKSFDFEEIQKYR